MELYLIKIGESSGGIDHQDFRGIYYKPDSEYDNGFSIDLNFFVPKESLSSWTQCGWCCRVRDQIIPLKVVGE